MERISFSQACADFDAVLERVVANRAPIAVTLPDGDGVVLIAQGEWDGMMVAIDRAMAESRG